MQVNKDIRYLAGLGIFISAFYLIGRQLGIIGNGAKLPNGSNIPQEVIENVLEQAKEVLKGTREDWEEFVREIRKQGLKVVVTKDKGIVIYDCEGNIVATEF